MPISFVNINPECEQLIKISVHGSPPRVRPFTSKPRTRGSQILIALLSTRNHNRIFSRCHYFPRSDEMNLATWEETKWQDSKAKANQPANRTPSSTGPPPDNFAISDEAKQKFTVAQGRDCRVQWARILVLTFMPPESATTACGRTEPIFGLLSFKPLVSSYSAPRRSLPH